MVCINRHCKGKQQQTNECAVLREKKVHRCGEGAKNGWEGLIFQYPSVSIVADC